MSRTADGQGKDGEGERMRERESAEGTGRKRSEKQVCREEMYTNDLTVTNDHFLKYLVSPV